MELKQLWKIARRWWWLIAAPALVVAAAAVLSYRPPAVGYSMALRFTAGQPEPSAAPAGFDPNYYRWLTSEYIIGGLKDWARTGAFAEAVSAELAARGAPLAPAAVAGAIVASDNARSILIIYLAGDDPAQLGVLAEAVTAVLQARNAEVFPQLGGRNAVITPLDTPNAAPAAASLRSQIDLPLKIALGLAAGLALALGAHYLDPFVRDREEVERLGLRVIALIPRQPRPGR